MFVVPLTGDKVETVNGAVRVVVSYSAYKNEPAVYVETDDASTPEAIPFDDIKKINGTPVKLTPGKVFSSASLIKRRVQLPQQNDKAIIDGMSFKVKSLKLRQSGKLTAGVLIVGTNEDSEKQSDTRMAAIDRIIRADGDNDFSRSAFFSLYKDYLGHSDKS